MSDLPDGWTETTLGEVARTQLGKMLSKKSKTGVGSRPYLRNKNVQWYRFDLNDLGEMDFSDEEFTRFHLQDGDLLVCEGGEIGRAAIWRGQLADCCFQKAVHRVKPAHGVPAEYLQYLLRHMADSGQLDKHVTGSTIKHLPQEDLRILAVPLAPAAEQIRIVAAIEEQFSRLDAAEESLHRARRNLARLRRTVLGSNFAGTLSIRRIDEVADVVSGQTPKALVPVEGGDIPFYKVGDMNTAEGRFMAGAREYLDDDAIARYRLRTRPPGTVIFPKRGGAIATNKKRVLRKAAVFDLNTMGLIPGPDVESAYLALWLDTVDLGALSDGSNVPQINHGDIAPLELPVPPLDEQRRIVAEVERQLSLIDAQALAIDTALKRSAALRRAILERAFAGKLVPQDPNDEPASVLLERIRAEQPPAKKRTRSTAPT